MPKQSIRVLWHWQDLLQQQFKSRSDLHARSSEWLATAKCFGAAVSYQGRGVRPASLFSRAFGCAMKQVKPCSLLFIPFPSASSSLYTSCLSFRDKLPCSFPLCCNYRLASSVSELSLPSKADSQEVPRMLRIQAADLR